MFNNQYLLDKKVSFQKIDLSNNTRNNKNNLTKTWKYHIKVGKQDKYE